MGKIVVELFSEAISVSGLQIPHWIAAGSGREGLRRLRQRLRRLQLALCRDHLGAALPLRLGLPRHRPLHLVGRSTSLTSTAETSMPQGSVRSSMIFLSTALIFSRADSSSSSSTSPSTERRVVWASWLVA